LVGIRQSLSDDKTVIVYTFVDPVLTVQNRAGFPAVKFTRLTSSIRLADGTQLPKKDVPLNEFLAQAPPLLPGAPPVPAQPFVPGAAVAPLSGTAYLQMPILSGDNDIRNVVYPGNNAPRAESGTAEIVIFGEDFNGNNIEIPITINLKFETLVFNSSGDIPVAAPSPDPTPSPGGQ